MQGYIIDQQPSVFTVKIVMLRIISVIVVAETYCIARNTGHATIQNWSKSQMLVFKFVRMLLEFHTCVATNSIESRSRSPWEINTNPWGCWCWSKTMGFHKENAHTHIRNATVLIKAVDQQVRVCRRRPTRVNDGCSQIIDLQSKWGIHFFT